MLNRNLKAVAAVCLFFLVGCQAPSVQGDLTATFMAKTPIQSPVATQTATPLPTDEPSPTATPAENWQEFSGDGFTIMLRGTYAGGSSHEEIQAIIDSLRNGGNDLFANLAEQNEGSFRFFAVDNRKSLVFRTSVNVIAIQNGLLSFTPTSILVETLKKQLDNLLPGAVVLEEGSFAHPQLDAYRLVYQVHSSQLGFDEDVMTAIVQYLIRDGDTVWIVSFSTPLSELDGRKDEFDKSAASFSTEEEK